MPVALNTGLRDNLAAILNGKPSPRQIDDVVAVCHALALSLLRRKKATGTLLQFHHISLSDLAYDCIAEIFSEHNGVSQAQLKIYFGGIGFDHLDQDEIQAYLSRLVFSKVNDGIFRCYHDVDPALSKILRYIKRVIQTVRLFIEVEQWNEICLTPAECETLEHLPPVDRADLEARLSSYASGANTIPDMLSALSRYLRAQEEHSRIVPMITAAVVFRTLFAKHAIHPRAEIVQPEEHTVADAASIIRDVCRLVKKEYRSKYVERGKVEETLYNGYFTVIEQNLIDKIIGQDGHGASLFAALQREIPQLTKDSYLRDHKSRVEYLARVAYERAMCELKKVQ